MADNSPRLAKGPWLEARDLNFSHGSRQVIKNLNLAFCPNRHYILAGPNGAGKSTALDLLSRLKIGDSGQVGLMGRDILRYDSRDLAKLIALAPQNSNFNFAFTVREVVRLGRRPHLDRWGRLKEEDHRIVEKAMEDLNLGHLADKPVTKLSGGEAQRVVLARTLAQDCPIVLLDEPTNSLDVAQALELMAILRRIAESGRLVVTVSHDLALAATFAHEIVFLKDGGLTAAGPRDEILTSELLAEVFEAEAQVRTDEFVGGLSISFRRRTT
ncbi:MAG: ABC transporter ATP-binding protein [Deltaproteobacteria bacterium]|jgi:iron complex transport system ATP-binding protein|nr:ABC transporter ATP-binding protein [Deltaproteobacteria bacterium]